MSKSYQLVIFDWDGTLMDSLASIVASMQQAARLSGLPLRSTVEVHEIIGLGLPEAIKALYPAISSAEADCMREHYVTTYLGNVEAEAGFYAGVRGLLDELRATDVWLSIATGKSRRGLDRVLAAQRAAHYFHSSRCADESLSKPHPQMLQELLAWHELEPQHAVMVGDTEHDLRMAAAAGVDAVAVTWGAHLPARLQACSPVYCAHSVAELREWLLSAVV
jgi:phosphoglycolate phosphatase